MPGLIDLPRITGVHLVENDVALTAGNAGNQRGRVINLPHLVILVEGSTVDGVRDVCARHLRGDRLRALGAVDAIHNGLYQILFTDVVDSTRLVERLGDAGAAEVWAAHDRRARGLARHHGREIGRTDGFFLLFDDAVSAASFAVAYHGRLQISGWQARVGLHMGPVASARTRRETSPEARRGRRWKEVPNRSRLG